MVNLTLFWLVALSFIAGHALLIRSAWRLRRGTPEAPAAAPSQGTADLGWTLLTAAATAALLAAVYRALV